MSVKSRRQALQLCFDAVVVVVVKIIKKFPLEMLDRLKFLQVKELTFEQTKGEHPKVCVNLLCGVE